MHSTVWQIVRRWNLWWNQLCQYGVYKGCLPSLLPRQSQRSHYQQWVRFARRHRPKLEPSKYSSLRSVHFEERCYSTRRDVAIELGIRAKLKNDATPNIDAAKEITTQLYNNDPRTQTGMQAIIKYCIKVYCCAHVSTDFFIRCRLCHMYK